MCQRLYRINDSHHIPLEFCGLGSNLRSCPNLRLDRRGVWPIHHHGFFTHRPLDFQTRRGVHIGSIAHVTHLVSKEVQRTAQLGHSKLGPKQPTGMVHHEIARRQPGGDCAGR